MKHSTLHEAAHIRRGKSGEQLAAKFLRKNGFRVINTNVRIHRDEIDIIAYDPTDDVMIFCEVKTRTAFLDDYRPELNITYKKRSLMARAARTWVAHHRWEGGYRMDVICIANNTVIEHYREIRWPGRRR